MSGALNELTEPFRAFSLTHALALAAVAVLTIGWITFGRRNRGGAATSLERLLAWSNLLIWFAAHLWWLLPPALDTRTTLPLQLCHLAAVCASIALLTRARWARTLVYFWGIGLSTQALLTPSITDPPASIWFWGFWHQHGFLLAAAAYDLAVHAYRPGWRDFRLACTATLGYLAAILPVNRWLGANYGFVGDSRPETPSIVDVLGPWPERLLIIVALVAVVFVLLKIAGGGRRQ